MIRFAPARIAIFMLRVGRRVDLEVAQIEA